MPKIKRIYLDTSVISHLSANDTPDKMNDTLKLWSLLKTGKFIAVISTLTMFELNQCPEPKKSWLLDFLSEIEYERIQENPDSLNLAEQYLKFGLLTEKSRDDCRHIAIATIAGCDYIISWNFKHFVNVRTIEKVQAINKLLFYNHVEIWPPTMIIEGDDTNE